MKINMTKSLLASAIFTGIFCGIWAGWASVFELNVWAGFAGCTAYFASGRHRLEGVAMTVATNLLGMGFGLLMVWLSDILSPAVSENVAVAIGVGFFVTCIVCCAAINWVAFVPGIFVGCYSLFAINLDWQTLGTSLIAGVILGVICDQGGAWTGKALKLNQEAT